jgi:hypothetical protein
MEIKELRIGNCLHYKNTNDIAIVELIHKKHFDCRDEYGSFTPNGNYKPIPLTEEWLLKFGAEQYTFDNGEPNQYRIGSRLFVIRNGKIVDYGTSVILEYVHRFQNFIYELTNEEPTWK